MNEPTFSQEIQNGAKELAEFICLSMKTLKFNNETKLKEWAKTNDLKFADYRLASEDNIADYVKHYRAASKLVVLCHNFSGKDSAYIVFHPNKTSETN